MQGQILYEVRASPSYHFMGYLSFYGGGCMQRRDFYIGGVGGDEANPSSAG